jgi:hypothetical protein
MGSSRTRVEPRVLIGVVFAALLAVSATGCGRDEALTGMGLPTLPADATVDGDPVSFQGVVDVGPTGCLMVGLTDPTGTAITRWALWPRGSEQVFGNGSAGNSALVDGATYGDGDRITGTGRLVDLSALPDGSSGRLQGQGRYCDAVDGGVLVIDDLAGT